MSTVRMPWERVDRSGGPDACWPWLGATRGKGYGIVRRGGHNIAVHRLVLSEKLGRPLVAHALHTCDNPPCCNPRHLFEGTNADNMADRGAKGRTYRGPKNPASIVRGKRNGRARLTDADVRYIRVRLAWSSQRSLAREFGVSKGAVQAIAQGRTWVGI